MLAYIARLLKQYYTILHSDKLTVTFSVRYNYMVISSFQQITLACPNSLESMQCWTT